MPGIHTSPPSRSYSDCLKKLYALKGGSSKQELDTLRCADEAMNFPSRGFAAVHVAGTNGKGSVCTMLAKACEAAGLKTGLYTSPHISCFRERIRIDGALIPEDTFITLLSDIFSHVEGDGLPLFFFDITTLLAFQYFALQKVDIAIIETGLGGRLDATNIVMPRLSIITSISYDHTEILGTTTEAIAREKAGIIKPGVPVIIGPCVSWDSISPIAQSQHSPLRQVKGIFNTFIEEDMAIAQAAMQVLDIPLSAQAVGLEARAPCRLECRQVAGQTVVMDVAHNPDGLEHLFKTLHQRFPGRRLRIVVGLSKGKDLVGCVSVLNKFGAFYYPVAAANGWNLPAEELAALLTPALLLPDVHSAVRRAIADAAAQNDLVVICGTFYIMEQARRALDITEPRDPPVEY